MKQFHVYGIGNALVDLDFEVSECTIERLNIKKKGVMTLIDEVTHHRLLEELDGIKHLRACGGSAANTLSTLQQLGGKTFYSCKVGNDDAGDFYYRDLVLHGIHTNLYEKPREGITGKCIALITPDAERTMNSFLGISAQFSINELSETALKNSEYLYIEGYLAPSPPGCEAAITAREMAETHHVKTAISLSDPNMVTYLKMSYVPSLVIMLIFYLVMKRSSAFHRADNIDDAKEILKIMHAPCHYEGGEGALIYNGHDFSAVSAYEVNVIGTLGAGDIFAGAFLWYYT